MKKAGVTDEQVALYEINEAFSAVALANMKILNLDAKKVNVVRGIELTTIVYLVHNSLC